MKTKPTPGSQEAIDAGCLCPVIDNHYGQGMPYRDGPRFWITGGCPLHDATPGGATSGTRGG